VKEGSRKFIEVGGTRAYGTCEGLWLVLRCLGNFFFFLGGTVGAVELQMWNLRTNCGNLNARKHGSIVRAQRFCPFFGSIV